ncbi:MAG: penicillin-binding protein 1A [Bacillota bacterium]
MPTKRKRKLNPWRFLIFVLLLLFFAGSFTALGLVAISIKDLPAWDEDKLYASATSLYYDQKGEIIARVGEENRVPVPIKDIPLYVQQAFIAIEDVRFYQHHGVDFRGILRAAWYNLRGGGIEQGASTITQQLVKLSFLTPERTLKRKIQEVILALMVERRYGKQEILQMYLNKIYFGNGAYGIQSAAQIYFGKNVKDLTLSEAAFLAGIPRAPNIYSREDQAVARRNLVLDTMAKYGFITADQAAAAKKEPLNFHKGNPGSHYRYPYFVDYVTEQLISRYGEDIVYKGGLRVYTTIDKKIQEAAEKAFANPKNFPASVRDAKGVLQPEGAAVFLDPQTGYVKAIVGGREHTHQLQLNRATDSPRQPGSAFKPIIAYGPAIELKGMAPASVIDDIPVKYGSYSPPNYDGKYRGLVTMRRALINSINVVAVRTLMDHVGIANAIDFASRLGFSLDPANHGPSMALGGLHRGVTTLQMAAAYAAFANGGIYQPPTAILKVESIDGKVLEEHKPRPVQAMKPTTAFLITSMLKDVIQMGTGTNARLNRPAAGKTGTTDESKDIWFAGYTPDLVGVVWIGYDQPKPMPRQFGGTYPALIWRQIMSEALQNVPARDFHQPPNIVTATVDSKSGLLPGPNTPPEDMVTDLFAAGTVPAEIDNTHVLVEVCATTGLLASEYCPERVTKVLIKLPYTVPEYVEDYKTRVPTEICPLHTKENQLVPGGPEKGDGSAEQTKPGTGPAPGPPDQADKQPGKPKPGNESPGKKERNIIPVLPNIEKLEKEFFSQ